MSCNGCRVLRKGCSDDCTIRPCLQWIKSPDSQANATMFLAKFYGRAGLLNLINSGPDHLRPAIFRSLLYEACGRIINPIYGSAGLLWSGNWAQCQSAVEAVLKGTSQFMQYPSSDGRASTQLPTSQPLRNSCDIRHIKKLGSGDSNTGDLHKVRTRTRFKRSKHDSADPDSKPGAWIYPAPIYEETSHRDSTEDGSMFSVETVEVTQIKGGRILSTSGSKTEQIWKFDNPVAEAEEAGEMPSPDDHQESEVEVGLELTLG